MMVSWSPWSVRCEVVEEKGWKAKTANTKLTRSPYFLAASMLAYFPACNIGLRWPHTFSFPSCSILSVIHQLYCMLATKSLSSISVSSLLSSRPSRLLLGHRYPFVIHYPGHRAYRWDIVLFIWSREATGPSNALSAGNKTGISLELHPSRAIV